MGIILFAIFLMLCLYIWFYPKKVETYKNIVCPTAEESFENKRFLKNEKCFGHGAISCKDVIEFLKLPTSANGLNDEQYNTAINLLSANTYTNMDPTDPETYNANECVMSQKDANDLKIFGCSVGDIELQQGNKPDPRVEWAHSAGCVLTEKHLKNNMDSILKTIYDKFRETPVETQRNLQTQIRENQDATAVHWDQYNGNVTSTGQQRNLEQSAKYRDAVAVHTTRMEAAEESRASTNALRTAPKASHNEGTNSGMKRNCQMQWRQINGCPSCGRNARERWQTVVLHSPENGGSACPSVQTWEQNCPNVQPCIPAEIHVAYNENRGAIRSAEDERYCVDVDGRNGRDYRANHATVLNYPCRNPPTAAQLLWRGREKSLIFAPSGRCLDVAGWGGNNADIIQWDCHHGANQQWSYHTDQSLRPGHNKQLCLTRYGEGMKARECTGAGNQRWVFRT